MQQTLQATPLKELGKHRVVDMSLGPTHSSLIIDTGKVFQEKGKLAVNSECVDDVGFYIWT